MSLFLCNTSHHKPDVHEAYVYIDGLVASKDGEPIMTDEEGHYSVDVPIGDHFIQIKKNGHTFTNNGRYPADPKSLGLRETFEAPVTGLTFWDDTKVMVAGRVLHNFSNVSTTVRRDAVSFCCGSRQQGRRSQEGINQNCHN